MDKIHDLQEILLLVRRTVGWTAEEFGERIGVTRQTINNLESKRNKLTKTQYLAIRSVLDDEINKYSSEDNSEMDMLKYILEVCVDHPEKYSEDTREKIVKKANLLAPSILAGTSNRKEVSEEWVTALKAAGVISSALIAAVSAVYLFGKYRPK